MNKWYFTGKGDQGEANLFNGRRISKGDSVLELIGSLDEANAHLSMAISLSESPQIKADLCEIQHQLYLLMGFLAGARKTDLEDTSIPVTTEWLEKKMDAYGKSVKKPQAFINAGKSTLGAVLDISRTIIRRAERIAVRQFEVSADGRNEILAYLNRLSSFLFILRLLVDISKN